MQRVFRGGVGFRTVEGGRARVVGRGEDIRRLERSVDVCIVRVGEQPPGLVGDARFDALPKRVTVVDEDPRPLFSFSMSI